MKLACALFATAMIGCGIDTAAPGDPGAPGNPGTPGDLPPGDPGDGTGPVTDVSGHITASTTWSNTIHVVDTVTIDAAVTVTVQAGTTVDVMAGKAINVSGTLDIQGTRDARVVFRSATPGDYWGDIAVLRGGTLQENYLVQTSGGLGIASGAKATVVNTWMSHSAGDLLTMAGGSLDMSYSQIGLDSGHDSIHCALHVSGPIAINVTHSNITTSSYGIMFYGGTSAVFTHNNWFGNGIDIDTNPAYPVSGDFSDSYFAKGAPTNPGVTATNLSTARLADAGVP
jgi:hypothetical protein